MPIAIPAVDVKTSKNVYSLYIHGQNTPGKLLLALTAVPTGISDIYLDLLLLFVNTYSFDGGILDNIPVNEVKRLGADKVIAINFKADDIDETSNFMDISMRTLDIMGNKISEESLQNSDFILTIKTDKTGLLDINKIDSCYKYGYKSAIKNLSKIKSILKY